VFTQMGCALSVPLDGTSVWEGGQNRKWYSCASKPGAGFSTGSDVRVEGAGMCADSQGRPDPTSLVVDMEALGDRTGCFAWVMDQCRLDLRQVKNIEFDVDLTQCDNLWSTPLELSPLSWLPPQGLSGEVNLLESCPVPSIVSNLGCYSLSGSLKDGCKDGAWGAATGLLGPKHVSVTLADSGNLTGSGDLSIKVCELSGAGCKTAGSFKGFLNNIHPTKGQQFGWPFEFRSDVWNGYAAGDGWRGCGATRNPGTKCKYAIKNVRVSSNSGKPVFSGGKCAALNADKSQW